MSNSKTISREDLYQLVWTRPLRDVAKDFGISDVGLGKICKRLNVPKPPPGYWQRIAAGYKVSVPPLPTPAAGVPREVDVSPTMKNQNVVKANPVIELLEKEKLPINRIAVSEDLHDAHRLVRYTNKILSKGKPDSYGRLMRPWNYEDRTPLLRLTSIAPILTSQLAHHRRSYKSYGIARI